MPLIHSKSPEAFKTNVRTLMHDVGKSPHVKSREQALAIAYSTQRRGKAAGGGVQQHPFGELGAARSLTHGLLNSAVPGRTDKLPITVGGGAYVLPADHVAALGQGNTMAGANIVNKMFKMGPYGSAPGALHAARPSMPKLGGMKMKADGGGVGKPTDIVAAGGEIVIPPDRILARFGGDLKKGHAALDKWVVDTRKKHIKTLRKLKPPKKD